MIHPARWFLLAAAVFAVPLLPISAQATLPAPWTNSDVGTCTYPGSSTYDTPSASFTVKGSGSGLGSTADSMQFCYQPVSGNFTLIARQSSNSSSGFGGLMVREALTPYIRAGEIYTYPQPVQSIRGAYRKTTNGSVPTPQGPTLTPPGVWLRLDRAGSAIYYYSSPDGTNWSLLYTQAFPGMTPSVDVGMTENSYLSQSLQTAVYDHVSLGPLVNPPNATPVPGTVTQSWIGNTFGDGDADQQVQDAATGMFVDTDGTCYATASGNEVYRSWGIYKNGSVVNYRINQDAANGNATSGAAVSGDSTFLYYSTNFNGSYGVDRVTKATLDAASFSGGTGTNSAFLSIGTRSGNLGNVWGLAMNSAAGVMYASDPLNARIVPITTSTMTAGTPWTVPNGGAAYSLAWDASDSLLWATVLTTSGTWQVWAFNTSGVQQTAKTISITDANGALADLTALSYSGGHLYVADNGPDQGIKVYQSLNTTPSPWITYGSASFGDNGTKIGTTGNMRFNGLVAIGIDGSSNIYVAQNGYGPDLNEDGGSNDHRYGLKLESYSLGTRALNWRLQGLEFLDCIHIDPTDETSAFGNFSHYSLNWSNTTPGSEWSAVGNTLNRFKYPTDYRLKFGNIHATTAGVFHVSGQKFLAISNVSDTIYFYRFQPTVTGETAVPCGSFASGNPIWTDANGDGIQDPSEVVSTGTRVDAMEAPYIDTNGTIWSMGSTSVFKYPCTTVNSIGAPVYIDPSHPGIAYTSLPGSDHFNNPRQTHQNRLVYDAASDTMYMLGFSTNYPAPAQPNGNAWAGAGSVIICYTHWSSTPPVFGWEHPIPLVLSAAADDACDVVKGMTGAGKYLFLQYVASRRVMVINKADGSHVGDIYPDPATLGSTGTPDTDLVISAFERSNGEYIITVEDDEYDKSIMYRWTGAP